MPLSGDLASLIGFACEAVLYGANAVLFLTSLAILYKRRHKNNILHPVVLLNGLIFLCCTTHFAIEFNHFIAALGSTGVDGYANETMSLLGADILVSVTDFLGDMVLIYRCWMIWAQTPIVIVLPFLAALGGLACIAGVAHIVLTTDPTSPAPPPVIVPLGLAGYVLPLCTNFIVTCLIAFKIWHASRGLPGTPQFVGRGASRQAMGLIIESGLLYFLAQLVYVVVFALDIPAVDIAAVMAVQIYGIAPTLIIIRVALGLSPEYASETMISTGIRWVARRGVTSGLPSKRHTDGLEAVIDMEDDMENRGALKDSMFKSESSFPTVIGSRDGSAGNDQKSYSPA
ncbi:hypothetical protein F5141DRAFT_91603 [Pisolithus sp. B1]|nr:hypothetical protein F5141DRAFT_91603 [Pisolithus sp. B1]